MKKLLFIAFIALFIISLVGCNDDGTGEPRDKVIIGQKAKPLEKQYAGFGILACIAVVGVWAVGNKAVRNQKPDRIKY